MNLSHSLDAVEIGRQRALLEAFIEQAIGLLDQLDVHAEDLEDDGSTEESLGWAEKYSQHHVNWTDQSDYAA